MKERISSKWQTLGAQRFEQWAQEHETPYYLLDADVIRARIEAVRDSLDGLVKVYYAVKANPNLEILRSVAGIADGLDVSSAGEVEQAIAAGHDPATLSFAGPAKSVAELRASIAHGVGNISVESVRELNDCIELSKAIGRPAHIVLRVNPMESSRSFGLKMGGRAVQFGIEEDELGGVLPLVAANASHLEFHGIHIYAGSQCFEPEAIVEGVRNTFRIARQIESDSPLVCRTINLGGGFGVSHSDADKELNVAELAPELLPVLREFREAGPADREIVFELGRYLTAEAGLYVARVISSKVSRGKTFFTTDGGLHHHLSAAGTFGTALRSNFVLTNLTRPDAPQMKCNIAGPSCNPTDLLGVNVCVPHPEHGDLIGIMRSGSYGLTASPMLFLGRRTPVELVLENDEVRVGRVSRSILDFN